MEKAAASTAGGGDRRCRFFLALMAVALSPAIAAAQAGDAEASAAGIRNRALGFEAVPGGPDRRIVLNPEMVGRLGIETTPTVAGKPPAVPAAAVFYDGKGAAWVYVSRKPGVYAGQRVEVGELADGRVLLADGLPAGTPVVTAGAAALNGAGMFGRFAATVSGR